MKKILLMAFCLIICSNVASAAPVQMPSAQKEDGVLAEYVDGQLLLSVGVQYDNVFERKLDEDGAEVEFQTIAGEFALVYNQLMKVYLTVGQMTDSQYQDDLLDLDFDNNLIWGVGVSVKSKDLEHVDIFTDIAYRQSNEMEMKSGTIGGFALDEGEADWSEWHIAVGLSKDFDYVTPYAGARYSDVDASATGSLLGIEDTLEGNADKNFGLFVGAVISPLKNFNIDIQGRFIDEKALMVSASLTF